MVVYLYTPLPPNNNHPSPPMMNVHSNMLLYILGELGGARAGEKMKTLSGFRVKSLAPEVYGVSVIKSPPDFLPAYRRSLNNYPI